jgi:hypothetical protein
MLTVFFVLALIVGIVVVWKSMDPVDPSDEAAFWAARELHAIRRRLEGAALKAAVRSDGSRRRRELRAELAALDEDERLARRRREDRR